MTPRSLAFALLDYFPYGGQQRDFLKIAQAALEHGHRVRALVHTWEGEVPDGIEVVKLAATGRSNHRKLQRFAAAVQEYRNRQPIDVLIGFVKLPGLDLYFAADPCYLSRALAKRGPWVRLLPRFRVLSALERSVFTPTSRTRLLVLTEAIQREYQLVYGTPGERFIRLPPGVENIFRPVTEAEREAIRTRLGLERQHLLYLMVGSHFRTKGVDRSLRALAALPPEARQQARLWIAGSGRQEEMGQVAASLGLASQVRFLGGRADVAELMRAADVLLQPSRTELAGMTIVEALSCELPVIASGECGYAFHVHRSGGGIALEVPFRQMDFEAALVASLEAGRRLGWRRGAGDYAATTDLQGLATTALRVIEALGPEGEAAHRAKSASEPGG